MKLQPAIVVSFVLLGLTAAIAAPLGSAFTYQGRLTDGGAPANGLYDFRFTLHDAISGGTQVGPLVSTNGVGVSDGLFNVELDFGAGVFTGNAQWLEIAARTNGASVFTTLTPRQAINPAPYALYALTPAGPQGPKGDTGTTGATGRKDHAV